MDLVEAHAKASARTGELIAGVRADQHDAPSPCKQWTARDLMNHLIGGQYLFAGAATGAPAPDTSGGAPDFAAGDAVGAYQDGTTAASTAFADPELGDRMAELPFGTVPGGFLPGLALFEQVVHGWDLAKATGQDLDMPDGVVDALLPFSQQFLANVPRDGHAFDEVVAVDDDAPALDRLLGLTGRQP